ncbi:heavy-metal-associated domain-containing protein [Enterococcus lemanii]|uniref:Heavy-metal-associated domain-containing protein n=1 Tax=Enterococcus lemanii TaxID=1159752 RepID=A0ABV9MRS8_9ENTE|nr:heavy-metal-associated domain-containing protein [Enterococcus lemanii]MBM7709109.1 copper chaperone CopZ [Enterococcus lemanii]
MEQIYFVENMKCQGCVSNIRQAVTELVGVESFSADLPEKLVTVTFDEKRIDEQQVLTAIQSAGYQAQLK